MLVINARNVNDGLAECLNCLDVAGVRRNSRNGEVTMFPFPVTTVYRNPRERVLWNAERDANPFFHFFESLWILAGRNDVKWISQFSSHIRSFSDDGETFNGGYGFRLRGYFGGRDQLETVVQMLKANPDERRCVLQMWDGREDLGSSSKDVPCNTAIYVSIVFSRLNITVTNRSNDIVWGCFGANVVHFSMLQEYLAGRLGLEVGTYHQISNNLHMYDFNKHQTRTIQEEAQESGTHEPYFSKLVYPYPLFNGEDPETWDQDLMMFMEDPYCFGYRHRFFSRVAKPLWFAYEAYRNKQNPMRYQDAQTVLEQCVASDWAMACRQWIQRREEAARRKAAQAAAGAK